MAAAGVRAPHTAALEQANDVLTITGVPAAGSVAPSAEHLAAVLAEFWTHAHDAFGVGGYVWHNHPLRLWVDREGTRLGKVDAAGAGDANGVGASEARPVIRGRLSFGDNTEDEWFAVFLVFQLSLRHPDIVFHMVDTDGDFLLIEAALVIPRWLKPRNSANRVLVCGGKLHIVPRGTVANGLPRQPTLWQAACAVRSADVVTEADDTVQACIQRRISVYPQRALDSTHTVRCIVPEPVAVALARDPALVAPAVAAFYTRDADDVSHAASMKCFGTGPCVATMVRFSRCLYAQLMQQKFHAPKVFSKLMQPRDHPDHHASEIGMKLACGFEMLAHRGPAVAMVRDARVAAARGTRTNSGAVAGEGAGGSGSDGGVGAVASTEALARLMGTARWRKFKASLQARGFFGDLHEGTVQYAQREQQAAESLLQSESGAGAGSRDDDDDAPHPSLRIARLLRLGKPSTWPPPVAADDDDKWLHEGAAELDRALEQQQRDISTFSTDDRDGSAAGAGGDMSKGVKAADDLVRSLSAFVSQQSDFKGVEPGSNAGAATAAAGSGAGDGGAAAAPVWVFADGADSDDSSSTDDEAGESGLYGPQRAGGGGGAGGSGPGAFDDDNGDDDSDDDSDGDVVLEVSRLFSLLGPRSSAVTGGAGAASSGPHTVTATAGGDQGGVAPATVGADGPDDDTAATSGGATAGDASGSASGSASAPPSFDDVMAAMDSQLRGTTLVKSFKRVGDVDAMPADSSGLATSAADITLDNFATGVGDSDAGSVDSDDEVGVAGGGGAVPVHGAGANAGASEEGPTRTADGSSSDEELAPVDVDFNLVSNLLASVHGQQGQAGPGSNILGEMGVAWRDVLEPAGGDGRQ